MNTVLLLKASRGYSTNQDICQSLPYSNQTKAFKNSDRRIRKIESIVLEITWFGIIQVFYEYFIGLIE